MANPNATFVGPVSDPMKVTAGAGKGMGGFHGSCYSYEMITTNGLWGSSSLVDFALPVFLVYVLAAVVTSQGLALLLRRLRQPRVTAEIISGIIWGPTLAGQFFRLTVDEAGTDYYTILTGKMWAWNMYETAAHLGLFFYIFLVGVDMDAGLLRRTAKKSVLVAAGGIALPVAVSGVALLLYRNSFYANGVLEPKPQFLVLLGIQFAATSFPVVTRILAELKLLGTDIGRIAMTAAIINEVVAWAALPPLLPNLGLLQKTDLFVYPWVWFVGEIASMVLLIVLCWFCVRPAVWWIQRETPEGESVGHGYLSMILGAALLSGFLADGIGVHYLVGGFAFGLAIPSGTVATALVEMLEEFVTTLMLPLYFTLGGVTTDLTALFRPVTAVPPGAPAVSGPTTAFIITPLLAGVAKIGGTVAASLSLKMPMNEALSLGLLMNCKSLLEVMLLDLAPRLSGLQPASFAALVIEFFIMTIVVPPAVDILCKSSKLRPLIGYKRRNLQQSKPDAELRMLTCVHNARNVPAIISLLEVTHPTKRSPIFVYALHLVELTGRASAMLIVHGTDHPTIRGRKHGYGPSEHIITSFQTYEQHAGGVTVQPLTAIAAYPTMHVDICAAAGDRHATMIILPFHKQLAVDGSMEEIHPAIRGINQKVLERAPCSVAILIDRGLSGTMRYAEGQQHHVTVLFFGGPDDREALAYAWRMAEHPGITLTVVRFLPGEGAVDLPCPVPSECEAEGSRVITMPSYDDKRELQLDDEYVSEFRLRYVGDDSVIYTEKVVNNSEETVAAIRTIGSNHDLYVVGRSHGVESPLMAGLTEWSEYPELGPIGDLLSSTDFDAVVSVLVVQQYVGGGGEVTAATMPGNRGQQVRHYVNNANHKSRSGTRPGFNSG